MKKRLLILLSALVISSLALAPASWADPVTIQVNSSSNIGISGALVQYLDGYWHNLGYTNAGGQATGDVPAGSRDFKVSYHDTWSAVQTATVPGVTPLLTFTTSEALLRVEDHNTADISGALVQYLAGYWHNVGYTGANGLASIELFSGSYDFKAIYHDTTSETAPSVDISGPGIDHTFQTREFRVGVFSEANVAIQGALAQYLAGYWHNVGYTDVDGHASIELFGCTWDTRALYGDTTSTTASGDACNLDAGGNAYTFHTTNNQVAVRDHAGSPIQGALAQYLAGYWHNVGYTDAGGHASKELFGCPITFGPSSTTPPRRRPRAPAIPAWPSRTTTATSWSSRPSSPRSRCRTAPARASRTPWSSTWRATGTTSATPTRRVRPASSSSREAMTSGQSSPTPPRAR